jgi:hypothetical protein
MVASVPETRQNIEPLVEGQLAPDGRLYGVGGSADCMMSPNTDIIRGSSRLFPSFFLGGFECSTPINFDQKRIDELVLTGHDRLVRQDYRRLRACGIQTARDGVRWNLVDKGGKLDFSSAIPFINAAEEEEITVLWDLFHYGYPDDLNPFEEPFVERFQNYCRAFARLLVRRRHGEFGVNPARARFYTPVNEISFFAWAGGEVGMFAPHAIGRAPELKRRLAEAAIAGINAIRDVDPLARFVNCDPLVRVVAPLDAPWLQGEADYFNEHFVCEAWDILAGRVEPQLGGSPAHLDILGVNYYGLNQWEHQRHESVLTEEDPRRQPLSEMLAWLYTRYEHPLLLAETSCSGDDRAWWLHKMGEECLKAMANGVDLHGLCIYPVLGMTEWHRGDFLSMGLWDSIDDPCSRIPHQPAIDAVKALQYKLEFHRALVKRPFVRPITSVGTRV